MNQELINLKNQIDIIIDLVKKLMKNNIFDKKKNLEKTI